MNWLWYVPNINTTTVDMMIFRHIEFCSIAIRRHLHPMSSSSRRPTYEIENTASFTLISIPTIVICRSQTDNIGTHDCSNVLYDFPVVITIIVNMKNIHKHDILVNVWGGK